MTDAAISAAAADEPAPKAPARTSRPEVGRNPARRGGAAGRLNVAVGIASIPLFLAVWQWVASAEIVNAILFPPPTVVAQAVYDWVASGEFAADLAASLRRVAIGFVIGAALGVGLGVLTGRVGFFAALLGPVLQILRPIPPIAFVPIVILWFGLSEGGKVFLIVWGVFFTVWISAHLGVQKVDQGLIRAAQMLGTPRWRLLGEVVLLGALPVIVVGLRTAVGISFYTLVAAELAGAFSGVFYRIEIAQQNMQTGQVFGGLMALGLLSFLADRSFAAAAQRMVWWR
ncbi:ABC transporter permease [Hansschlegelia zhihuaiae]|uniref:ABC transporter permease n=1 Tax=Hansschlegelia zhihuaiae TaxID=405005 RepID=A0A4Q0MQA3_9HYPH|nr:ABC transporter permease [Hansschlegelia zhihuaiae]RXF75399.1 ABC transporter permease [Hansschlegelia zhihuaiae]